MYQLFVSIFIFVVSEYLLVRALLISFLIYVLCISNYRKCEKFKLHLERDSPKIEMDSRNIIMLPSFFGTNRFSYQISETNIDDHDNSNSTNQYNKAVLLYFIQSLSYKLSVPNFCISNLVKN
jgi:predicted membrane protein